MALIHRAAQHHMFKGHFRSAKETRKKSSTTRRHRATQHQGTTPIHHRPANQEHEAPAEKHNRAQARPKSAIDRRAGRQTTATQDCGEAGH
ncbi:hypothetical protein GOP47_0006958 [Adiantum capillus-veneris]|uniref:Uncharacterized protein n=1 Tax=Adiantum capillus-veneris TaxID=13818 RepID=A0A9D4V020_ADICA|nr:hypothetical protein GOP47_0006958 [Adiantum capillus-veneris]